MSSKSQNKSVSLNLMLGTAMVAWAAIFAWVHGPFVFGYIGMHAVTTGIFVMALRRADRKHAPALATQPATAKAGQKRTAAERLHTQPAA